jgi:hypothetical protein
VTGERRTATARIAVRATTFRALEIDVYIEPRGNLDPPIQQTHEFDTDNTSGANAYICESIQERNKLLCFQSRATAPDATAIGYCLCEGIVAVLRRSAIKKRESPRDNEPVHPFEQWIDYLVDLTA